MKRIKIILPLILLSALGLFGFLIARKIGIRQRAETIVLHVPDFRFVDLDGRIVSRGNMGRYEHYLIFNYFDPECDHCQYMARQIAHNSTQMRNFRIIMVTGADSLSARIFRHSFGLDTMGNIQVVRDVDYSFFRLFGTGLTPCFFIYDSKGDLRRRISGATRIELLTNGLN